MSRGTEKPASRIDCQVFEGKHLSRRRGRARTGRDCGWPYPSGSSATAVDRDRRSNRTMGLRRMELRSSVKVFLDCVRVPITDFKSYVDLYIGKVAEGAGGPRRCAGLLPPAPHHSVGVSSGACSHSPLGGSIETGLGSSRRADASRAPVSEVTYQRGRRAENPRVGRSRAHARPASHSPAPISNSLG
ncbi:hypothetical protein T492DRAFT_1066656 [Pavlovales sp. CCMP2436]|nr:hypothetical protein T492DRAFT_1066656 [Pavlovales sp. CCMP2436]